MEWYFKVLRQYADFNGRARRTEFWMFALFNMLFSFVASFVDRRMGIGMGYFTLITSLYSLFVLIPSIAVGIRRLHDIGKSGWMLLVGFIPVLGAIWLIILFATEGTPGENEFGINPKEV